MNHMHYFYISVIYDIEDHIRPYRKAAHAAAQIIAGATHARKLVDQMERLMIASMTSSAVPASPLSLKI